MINTSEHKSEDTVKSGVVDYPIGFPFYFNPDRTPQLLVKIGDEELRFNHNFELSEDKGSVVLRPTEEESWTLEGPEDFSWMTKWDGKDLLIERAIPFVQDSDYQLGRISSEQIERDFDLSVMRDQILADKISEHADEVQGEIGALHSRIDFVQEEHLLDMAAVDEAMATKATKTELENAKIVLGEGIQGNADAIQKTREDYIEADSEIHQILNNHASELTTLRGNQASLGDQVSGIEEKIPGTASATNQLATKADLKDIDLDGYVKKSGDTMTGDLAFDVVAGGYTVVFQDSYKNVNTGNTDSVIKRITSNHQTQGLVFSETKNGTVDMQFTMIADGFFMPRGNRLLGSADYPWKNIYAKKLNNGSDIIIPSEGGTLARVEDLIDLRADINEADSELQTQITAQSEEIAKKQDELIAGENITIVDNVISATGGGNYLPLTGGTLTGPLGFSGESDFGDTGTTLPILRFNVTAPDGSVLEKTISVSPNRFMFFDGLQFHGVRGIHPTTGISCNLGTVDETWKFLFVNKIRNGSGGVLNVPTDGGTLARVEDIDTIGGDGTTGQVLTKTDTGMAWTTVQGGGGGGIADVVHDGTMNGSGTDAAPLGVNTDVIATKDFVWEIDAENVSGMHDYLQDYIWPEINTLKSDKQDKLTAGENITIVDNVISASAGGGASLPDQTGNAGTVLTTDGQSASWSLGTIGFMARTKPYNNDGSVIIAVDGQQGLKTIGAGSVIVGGNHSGQQSTSKYITAIGVNTYARDNAIAIGCRAGAIGDYSIQLGQGTNMDANTFKVSNENGNFEIMSADGTIPAERMSATTGTTGQVLTKTDTGMAWTTVQGGGGSGGDVSLPDQTGNAGKFLKTDGTTASWGDALVNNAQGAFGTAVGTDAKAEGMQGIAIGYNANAYATKGIAIGYYARAFGQGAIQIGEYNNSDANTFKVGNANGNFEMMDADGKVPLERLTYVTDQIGDISTALTAILGE